ncbi:FTR1 family iron permease [Janthinobacterium fluminis]|uniref:FTR1 family protein n=1 Tax=Janthinobacterium fluminis TaxID=2987524 RepID=A0ABT5JV70_9BURK|nr:FTR1 family protein [Janthinobacterium fluminis]MDC8756637.1 FTR1 family protein [Janthinobacterium fluminis]
MGNALFIVWRESVEAMLVVGILYAWIKRNDGAGMRALWAGAAAGIALAAALGWAMVAAQDELSGAALEWFQLAMLLTAAALIVQMVLWMQKHGRHMKQQLENDMARAAQRSGAAGVAVIAALAIAREGAETAIFLYGMGLSGGDGTALAAGAALGFALALLTAWAVSSGLRFLDYRQFFRVSGLLLLLFAAALLASAVDRLIGGGWLPALVDPLWDSSALLDDASGGGAALAAFTGYRARPSLTLAAVYALYWLGIVVAQRRRASHG